MKTDPKLTVSIEELKQRIGILDCKRFGKLELNKIDEGDFPRRREYNKIEIKESKLEKLLDVVKQFQDFINSISDIIEKYDIDHGLRLGLRDAPFKKSTFYCRGDFSLGFIGGLYMNTNIDYNNEKIHLHFLGR